MKEFEKLGSFYLGRVADPSSGQPTDDLFLYDSRDLTTHAVCVGMTGSGKTGLCIDLLEEAAIDGIPAIAIDPKGDLGNLLLAFPEMRPADFRPWVDEGEAARAGLDPDAFAAKTAETWRKGLADWGQDGARIARFRDAVDLAIYTPGSTAGAPIAVLKSLAAPAAALRADGDFLRERITTTVSGLLALAGIDADPIRSREHVLLSTILGGTWGAGRDLEIGDLVRAVGTPPFSRVGVIDLESFYPAKERTALMVALNNLLASPGFAAWTEGEPLDVRRLLYTEAGKPRLAVVSIAHLSDAERMFFVTLLLNEVLAWVRGQPGTSSLRAILYMDEVFGFFPPTANPPSKTPMLTLLKQARAFGLGIVLATQNPVDLDYKGLSNAGTWFLGRLQTERDKMRVIDGLEGAAATAGGAFDRAKVGALLAGLKARTFLMSNAHEQAPVLFQSRWALSYLRGPLTRAQIQTLTAGRRAPAAAGGGSPGAAADDTVARPVMQGAARPTPPSGLERPALAPGIPEFFATAAGGAGNALASAGATLAPALVGTARVHYVDAKASVDLWQKIVLRAALPPDLPASVWENAALVGTEEPPLTRESPAGARFAPLPSAAAAAKSYVIWGKALADAIYQSHPLALRRCAALKLVSRPDESEGDFLVRVRDAVRADRDRQVEMLRAEFAPRLATLQERRRRASERVEREQSQFQQQTLQTAISVGATVLGALLGRRAVSTGTIGRATTAMRGAGRALREHGEVGEAEESAGAVDQRIQDLQKQFDEAIASLRAAAEPAIEETVVRPRKSDTGVDRVALVWFPVSPAAPGDR
ncbi:MAG TPA: ATP-binding protein [Patescibacteria group bacterium]|nr:ATP-binding protein [Patescibacteria group bacterium]